MLKEISIRHQIGQIKGIFQALRLVFSEGEYADKALETVMHSNKTWRGHDRSFIVETTYDIIRYWRLLASIANVDGGDNLSDKQQWEVFGVWLVFRGYHLPDHPAFGSISAGKIKSKLEKFSKIRKIRESI